MRLNFCFFSAIILLACVALPACSTPRTANGDAAPVGEMAVAHAERVWAGHTFDTAEGAALWITSGRATAEHNPTDGTVVFAGPSSDVVLHFAPSEPMDVHQRTGFRVRFKGSGDFFMLRLTDVTGASAGFTFGTSDGRWTTREFAFEEFDGDALDLSALAAIEFDPEAGPFRLELDAVETY